MVRNDISVFGCYFFFQFKEQVKHEKITEGLITNFKTPKPCDIHYMAILCRVLYTFSATISHHLKTAQSSSFWRIWLMALHEIRHEVFQIWLRVRAPNAEIIYLKVSFYKREDIKLLLFLTRKSSLKRAWNLTSKSKFDRKKSPESGAQTKSPLTF